MRRRSWLAALLSSAIACGFLPASAAAVDPPPLPSSIAAVGDSISQAASSGGGLGTDYPENSWSTGTAASVNSHYLRLAGLNPAITGMNFNRSVSGAKMVDLNSQMQQVVALQPDYLTVLIGGNDLCTDTATQMTPISTFSSQFETAMNTLTAGSPTTNVYVVSIPRVYHLWELFKGNFWARFIWSVGNVCQSLLANPLSTDPADVARRAEVAQRNIDFNSKLAEVCATFASCRFDNNAVYNTEFVASDAAGDYFHPSISGQAKLARVSWAAGFWANAVPPTPVMQVATPLTYTRASTAKTWNATVAIQVLGPSGEAVPNATVSATWSRGAADTCLTTSTGRCTVTSDSFNRRNVSSVVMTVANVTHATYAWDAPNPKPSITIARP